MEVLSKEEAEVRGVPQQSAGRVPKTENDQERKEGGGVIQKN